MATTIDRIREETVRLIREEERVRNRETATLLVDGLAETQAAYEHLRRIVRDLLDAVDYSADNEHGYDVRVRNLVSAALSLAALDRLTGGGR